ncbi:site-specific integrase [Mucilaginibacter limnophilus]|uniref:Site-specific integrase n=2 Tax=Mucilaginibacter limnophilus TaxID=1932778 RepID=A0A3S2V258_9SPHI|nr:site-specific integrase [Mucilaginibacter limnophilus]
MSKNFTQPFLNTGKPITSVPKGSTKAKEQAKADWYVEFSYLNPETGRMQRFRKTHDGNRVKDPQIKQKHFNALLEAYKDALEAGWSPVDEQNNAKLRRAAISISLAEGKTLFQSYHKHKGTRPKSIATYLSKVNAFINHYGADTKVDKITDYEVTSFLNHQEATFGWVGSTYVNARINLNNFFKYLKSNKYIPANPVTDTETRRKIKTEKHKVFSDEDFNNIMAWLKANDPYALLFCRTIYYTCIRPKELRHLQLKHINLKTGVITVPANIAKNKRPIPVKIDPSLMKELELLMIDQYSEDFYLFGCTLSIVGGKRIGENTPYNRFRKCLKHLNLLNKNYDMYSFKHLSNVRKFLAGWTVAQISKANRHSNISETETYLKDLLDFVEIDKEIPAI